MIADVAMTNGTGDKPTSFVRTATPWLIACSLLFCVLALLRYVVLLQPATVTLTSLTAMAGSEVSPSYNAEKNLLIFSHRANKDDYLQLYARDLDSGRITRLTFDEANYANGHLSPKGDKIAYTRSTPAKTTTFIADFSAQYGLSSNYALPDEVSEQRYLQAWSSDGAGLYLSDLKQPDAGQGIWYYQLTSQELSSVTSSAGFGSGDYFARESHDGQFLAILRNTGANDNELLVQHLPSGELVHAYKLARSYQHLVWDKADRLLTLSSFYAEFAQYDLARGQLKVLPLNIENINHAFYSCAERCLFARQHSGNYLDLVMQPNPVSTPVLSQYDYLQFSGVEDFPVTGRPSGNIYLINKQHKESQIAVIQGDSIKVLKALPVDSEFAALQVNPSETHLAGIMNSRLFLLNLASQQFKFLTTELEQVASVQWTVSDGELHYARIEHGKPVLYRYELASDIKVRVEVNRYAQQQLANDVLLVIDSEANVWRYDAGSKPVLLTRLPDISANRWQVQQNWLYYTGHEENLAYLYRIHIATGVTEKQLIAKNRFRLNFDLSADGTAMLAVRSVLAQSDLVKLQY